MPAFCDVCGKEIGLGDDVWTANGALCEEHRPIEVNDSVIVPVPDVNDSWRFEFVGTVIETVEGEEIVSVEDREGWVFDVERSRLRRC